MNRFNMGFSFHWSWLAALSCLLCMGGEVWCVCTEKNIQIEGGHYTLNKELERGSLLIYHCPEGYYPYPALTRLCQPNGAWTPAPKRFTPQRCRIVECPDPSVLEYGNVFPPQEKYFVSNETTYECYSGYTMRGSSRRVCLQNGKWSGSTPICSHDSGNHCANPGIPAGASRTGNIFGFDDKVTYSCNGHGLFLVGSSERVCLENGQWTGEEPACYYRHTYDTSLEVSKAFGSSIIDSLTTLQPTDDTQEGRSIRISKNGTLNIYIAVDVSESIEDDHIKNAKDAILKLITKISSFSVTPNYEVIFFSSDVLEAVKIVEFLDGKKSRSSIQAEIEKFQVASRNDAAGTNLNLVFQTFLEKMAFIKRRVGEENFKEHRHVLMLFTDGAYNMGGSPEPTVAKIKNMVYMNHTSEGETQSREEYLDIYIFAIGAEILDDDLQRLKAGVGGEHYFRMKDIKNLQKTFDDIIDEGDVKGLCGLHKDYDTGGKPDKREKYPWWAYIFVKLKDTTKKCLGSLVTPRFVLTAAHCFSFEVLPKDVKVEIDDGNGIVKTVKNFIFHPKYNISAKAHLGVREFYDYDVALIQLESDVEISVYTRPICIPCTQETRGALNLDRESTCKDQEQLLFKTDLERLNFLTKTSQGIHEKDVIAKLGKNRGPCIAYAREAPGITANETEAVTDNFLCTGGLAPQRDHIACTGDSGGAVFKNYEHRTIQVALVSWGSKDVCKEEGISESIETSRDFHINLFRVVPFLNATLGDDKQDDYAPLTFLKS